MYSWQYMNLNFNNYISTCHRPNLLVYLCTLEFTLCYVYFQRNSLGQQQKKSAQLVSLTCPAAELCDPSSET